MDRKIIQFPTPQSAKPSGPERHGRPVEPEWEELTVTIPRAVAPPARFVY